MSIAEFSSLATLLPTSQEFLPFGGRALDHPATAQQARRLAELEDVNLGSG